MKASFLSKNRHVFWLIAICSFVLYGNTLMNDYNIDDAWAFQDIEQTDLATGIKKSFASNYVNVGEVNYGYRPVTSVSFKLEQAVFGQNPFISHLINLLLYVAVCYLLFLWLHMHVKLEWWISLTATMIFLLFPIHTEVVNSVKNRDELLSALFALGFLIWLWKYANSGRLVALVPAVVLLAVSVLSKTGSLPLLVAAPVGLWLTTEKNYKRLALATALPIVSVLLIRVLVAKVMIGGEANQVHSILENPLYGDFTGTERFMVALNSFGFYLSGLFSFGSFSAYYGAVSIDFLQWNVLYLILVVGFLAAGLFVLIRYIRNRQNGALLFAFVFTFLCISPFLNAFFITPGVVGERLVFLSSMGMALLLAFAIHFLLKQAKNKENTSLQYGMFALLGIVLLVWSVKTINRNAEWRNMETLMTADLEKYPNSVKMNVIMGSIQFNNGVSVRGKVQTVHDITKIQLARDYFETALNVYEDHASALYNVAWIDTYVLNGDVDETKEKWQKLVALKHLKEAEIAPFLLHLERRGGNAKVALDESLKECQSGNHDLGLIGIRQSLEEDNWDYLWLFSECLYPDLSLRRKQLTEMWKRLYQSNPDKATKLLNALVEKDETPYFRKVKVQFLLGQSRFAEAEELLRALDAENPSDYEVKILLGNVNISLNNKEAALEALKAALLLQPENEELKNYIRSLENDSEGVEN